MNFIFQFLVGAIFAISTSPSAADPKWYNDVYPSNKNSQISLLNQGGGSVTAIRNPTAASVQLNANTSTQPPSVFVQATATLPVASIGASCDPAKNTAGLSSSDRLTILVCPPTGLWTISNRTRLRQVNENDPCDPALDGNLAVNSTGLTLSCQSGSPSRWARAQGSNGNGMSGVLKPLAGMSISCSGGNGATYYAYVDASGMPFARAICNSDSGWVPGFVAGCGWGFNYRAASWSLDGLRGYSGTQVDGMLVCGPVAWPSS